MKSAVDILPEHWKQWLRDARPEHSGQLSVYDFPPGGAVRLHFEDGSTATFRYAFYVVDEARHEIAVFTEHCGYHVFSSVGLEWEGMEIALR